MGMGPIRWDWCHQFDDDDDDDGEDDKDRTVFPVVDDTRAPDCTVHGQLVHSRLIMVMMVVALWWWLWFFIRSRLTAMCTYMYARLFWWWWCPLPCLPDWYSLLSYLFKYVPDLHFCSAEDLLRFFVPQKDNLLRFLLQEAQSSQIFVAQKDNLLRFLLQRITIFSDRPPSYLFFSSVPSSTLLQCIGVDVWKNPVPIGF